MAIDPRRLIAALLLASYGLISACGSGLHTLVDGGHGPAALADADPGHEGDPHAVPPLLADHGDCLLCHVVGQGQLLAPPVPACRGLADVGASPTAPSPERPTPDRLPGDPRGPPSPLS